MDVNQGAVSSKLRKQLAATAYALTATYDSNISSIIMALGDPTRRAVVERLAGHLNPVEQFLQIL